VRIGHNIANFFLALVLILIIVSLLSKTLNFNPIYFALLIPFLIYKVYIKYVVNRFYLKSVDKLVENSTFIPLKIDDIVTSKVKKKIFTYFSMGAYIDEYYFTFFNQEYATNITVSTLGVKPPYYDKNLKSWKHKTIEVFLNKKLLDNKKSLKSTLNTSNLRSFSFRLHSFNLEKNYLYNYNEEIARRKLILGLT